MDVIHAGTIVAIMLILFWVLTMSTSKSTALMRPYTVRPESVSYTHEQSLFSSLFGQELTSKKDPYSKPMEQTYNISRY